MNKNNNTNNTQFAPYNKRLVEDTSKATPAGWFDATVPLKPRVDTIVTKKDYVNYLTGVEPGASEAFLSVLDSPAGRNAVGHEVYVQTQEEARCVFAGIIEYRCLIKTAIDIFYKNDSDFVPFEPVDVTDRPAYCKRKSLPELFVDRYTAPSTSKKSDEQSASETAPKAKPEIPQTQLLTYFTHWLHNYTVKEVPSRSMLKERLLGVEGLERVSPPDDDQQSQYYWRLENRVWTFESPRFDIKE